MDMKFVNAKGNTLSLMDNPYFHLINIDGQTAAASNISSLIVGDTDGDIVNNVQAQPRPIILDLRIKSGVNVEDAKRFILNVVKLKQNGTLKWTQNDRTVLINGVVESVDMPRWNNTNTMQITLHCEQPFWEDIDYVIQQIDEALGLHYFSDVQNEMLYFPAEGIPLGEYDFARLRTFNNVGDVTVGMEIEIIAYDTVTNPIIYDENGNFFGIGHGTGNKKVTMQAGDIIKVDTRKGQKSVKMNGVSLLGKLKPNSTWLQIAPGDNTFSINSDDASINNMSFSLIFKRRYI